MRTWTSMEEFDTFVGSGGMVEPTDDMPDAYREEVFRFIEFMPTRS
ncbi:MAG: hypothetical protein R2705_02280 [Ilumatobacteraceae bacterium]